MTHEAWIKFMAQQETIVLAMFFVTGVYAGYWFVYPKTRRFIVWLPVLLIALSFALPAVLGGNTR